MTTQYCLSTLVGEIASVEGTPMDLRKPVNMGERLGDVPGGKGFDTSYCVGNAGERKLVARYKLILTKQRCASCSWLNISPFISII